MPVSERTSKIVWGQSAARCCICRGELLHSEGAQVTSLIGEIAHIVGETKSAARGVSSLTSAQRNEEDNLMLLCRPHHKIIDDDSKTYTVSKLRELKEAHISWVSASLLKKEPWRSKISQLTYINVPRLCEQAELQGYRVDLSSYRENQTLHSLGWELNHVMAAFQAVLPRISVSAVPIADLRLHEGFIGAPVSFERQRFRTKNVPGYVDGRNATNTVFTGDLQQDPHIYAQLSGFRVALFIDPRWITTSTAFTLFRPSSGQSTFSGLGRVTGVDYSAEVLTVTPWVIGLPGGIFDEEVPITQSVNGRQGRVGRESPLDSLVDMVRARKDDVHFDPPPTHCDLCRRTLEHDRYMIDGAVKGLGGWACMCERCFHEKGKRIGWGYGQLYLRDEFGWLEVAGFPPEDEVQ